MDNIVERCAEDLLIALGIEPTETTRAQLAVMAQAVQLFAERDTKYGGVWQQYGALSNLVRSATKVDRLMNVWWHGNVDGSPALHKDSLDDAFDMINYMIFFIRCAREGNVYGTPQRRPLRPVMTDTD